MLSIVSLAALSVWVEAEDPSHFDAGRENKAGLTFSPDGSTAYWVEWDGKWGGNGTSPRVIYVSQKQSGRWSEPSPVPFSSGGHNDDDPFVSLDGAWLYFVSDRPAEPDGKTRDGNIWRYRLHGGHEPELVDVNSPREEYSPIVTESGSLYFASNRNGGRGQGDIFIATREGDGFSDPVPLGPPVNSKHGEWNLWVAADESMMIFESSSRPTNISIPGDLYLSIYCIGEWAIAYPLSIINTQDSDLLPRMHPDGVTLYYTTAPIGGHAKIRSTGFEMTTDCND